MWNRRSATFQYAVLGSLFGLLFPVFSTLGDILIQSLPWTLESVAQIQANSPLHWVIDTAPLFLGLFAILAGRRQDQVRQQIQERDQALAQLELLQAKQEEVIHIRTADLARRNAQLEIAAQIARDTAAIRSLEQLLNETVRLISDRFGFYHAGIFLLDEARKYAVLRAASSKGGRRMLARSHRLKVGRMGIVGYVTARGKPRIALDVGTDATYFDNPDLPDTRSEMAVPLRIRDEIIGALDVQSLEPKAFSEDDIIVLQAVADQVAVAIFNAQLFQQAEESLQAQRRAYGDLGRDAWRQLLYRQQDLGHRYDPDHILPVAKQWREETKAAVQKGKSVQGWTKASATLAIPIRIHNQVIGVLDAHKPISAGEWTSDEIDLLEALTEQLSLALDSARLHHESQRRASREQLIGEVAGQLRSSLDIDTVLQTAVREMGAKLGLAEVEVRMTDSRKQS